jgi:hypothetical protein
MSNEPSPLKRTPSQKISHPANNLGKPCQPKTQKNNNGNNGNNGNNSIFGANNSVHFNSNPNIDKLKKMFAENELRCKKKIHPRGINDKWMYDKIVTEIILQSYLIYTGYRNVAEIKITIDQDAYFMDAIIHKLKEYDYKSSDLKRIARDEMVYEIHNDDSKDNVYYLYLYLGENAIKMDSKNISNRGVAIANKLGEGKLGDFYTCKAESDEWKTYKWRIIIHYKDSEILAQMCKPEQIYKNMKKTMLIYQQILELFQKLNKKFLAIPTPLKLSIYKTTVHE